MNAKPLIVSVVRDFAMYDRCVGHNHNLDGCELRPIDNRAANDYVGVCYNRVIDTNEEDCWIVFCHEDFEIKEPLIPLLKNLDRSFIYGPVGAITVKRLGCYYQWRMIGQIEESKKNGDKTSEVGYSVSNSRTVDTLDCQCVIVHSSLLRKTGLRFDEQLSFDLYVEDFCIAAKEHHKIASYVVPIKCHHWSKGFIQPRYYDQIRYLKHKWPSVAYTGTAYQLIGGGGSPLWRLEVAIKQQIQKMSRFSISKSRQNRK